MKAAYLDSCAIVKLCVNETFSSEVETLYRGLDKVLCHGIGHVEVRAALAAAHRAGRLETSLYQSLVADFCADWSSYSVVGLDNQLIERAAELAEGFGLRGYDSVHLASADRVRAAIPNLSFVSLDKTLNRAAKLLSIAIPEFILV